MHPLLYRNSTVFRPGGIDAPEGERMNENFLLRQFRGRSNSSDSARSAGHDITKGEVLHLAPHIRLPGASFPLSRGKTWGVVGDIPVVIQTRKMPAPTLSGRISSINGDRCAVTSQEVVHCLRLSPCDRCTRPSGDTVLL